MQLKKSTKKTELTVVKKHPLKVVSKKATETFPPKLKESEKNLLPPRTDFNTGYFKTPKNDLL